MLNGVELYVLANAGVLNACRVVAANFLEYDNEIVTLPDKTGDLVDAIAYETNKGVEFEAIAPADKVQVATRPRLRLGPGIFGNS